MDLHREHGARAQDKGQRTGKGTSDLILILRFSMLGWATILFCMYEACTP